MDTDSSKQLVRLALIGASKQGREHLAGASEQSTFRFCAICDLDSETRAKTLSEYSGVLTGAQAFASLQELADASLALDGLVVALPHHIVKMEWENLLAFGIPLLKEKPLGRNLFEARRFIESARGARVPLVTAVQRRTHPSYQELRRLLTADPDEVVEQIVATLHLGFDPTKSSGTWRDDRTKAGGGALLDSGYHMVDLVQYLIGPVGLVHATLWDNGVPAGPNVIETDAILTGRAGNAWVRIESRVGGKKGESVEVETSKHRYFATREGVWCDGEQRVNSGKDWLVAMREQLEDFAGQIRSGSFDDPRVWEQLPAMRVIDSAYALMSHYGQTSGGMP